VVRIGIDPSFTDPYIHFSRVIIARIDSPFKQQTTLSSLEGFRAGNLALATRH